MRLGRTVSMLSVYLEGKGSKKMMIYVLNNTRAGAYIHTYGKTFC